MSAVAAAVHDLRVELVASGADVVDEINFELASGEVLGIVGESASGKTTVAQALLGYARRGARIARGQVCIGELDLLSCNLEQLRDVRGGVVAYIPQDPVAALSPALRIGAQLDDVLQRHAPQTAPAERRTRILETLEEVSLPAQESFLARYPHQLSGGQLQRIAIAMAFAPRPRVIVADEPTTGLDVTTQAHVLETIQQLARAHGAALLYVSHDLAVVAGLADRVAVMYAGRIVEQGSREQIFHAPRHPYTAALLRAAPRFGDAGTLAGIPGWAPAPGLRPAGCAFAPRCRFADETCRASAPAPDLAPGAHAVRCFHASETVALMHERPEPAPPVELSSIGEAALSMRGIVASYGETTVVHGVDLDVAGAECVALVGESGSGKTTLARCAVGLHSQFDGSVTLSGIALARGARQRTAEQRRRLQYIFQSPYASLNPRRSIGRALTRQVRLYFPVGAGEAQRRTFELLERVSLPAATAARHPGELSGGECQRVAIARALAARPAVLVCDEITSSLDVSVQAAIVNLLQQLRAEEELSLLFVTHNLALVRSIADRVAVLSAGRVVELGPTAQVFQRPQDAYTRQLIANTPVLEEDVQLGVRMHG
ncbi:MAG TPA: ABC transporter ATP-binding protein [Solirubrobacteraceae bacterium]|jgi:peptide/nickel transport system ATP-binding protein